MLLNRINYCDKRILNQNITTFGGHLSIILNSYL